MSDIPQNYRSREPHYLVAAGQSIALRVSHGDNAASSATLCDLSVNGLRFLCADSLAEGTIVELQISLPQLSIEILRQGEIVWSQAAVGSNLQFLHGVRLLQPLREETITSFAEQAVLERRRDHRIPVSVPGTVRSELSPSLVTVEIVNYSAGGFCVRGSNLDSPPGGRLMVSLQPNEACPEALRICGRIQWSRREGDFHVAGCSFLTRQDFQNLHRHCSASTPPAELARRRPTTRWALVSAAMLVILLSRILLPGSAVRNVPRPQTASGSHSAPDAAPRHDVTPAHP